MKRKIYLLLFIFLQIFSNSAEYIPQDWMQRIKMTEMIYSNYEPEIAFMPAIGNGYIATVVDSGIDNQ